MNGRTLTYAELMQQSKAGDCVIHSWGSGIAWNIHGGISYADVTFFEHGGDDVHECVTVTDIPLPREEHTPCEPGTI